jgi:hypothetical protein
LLTNEKRDSPSKKTAGRHNFMRFHSILGIVKFYCFEISVYFGESAYFLFRQDFQDSLDLLSFFPSRPLSEAQVRLYEPEASL